MDYNFIKPMKRIGLVMLFIIQCSLSVSLAQIGTWQAYMSYYDVQQIVEVNQLLFVRASNSLYKYNMNDQSITTYDKMNGMSDTDISMIAWNPRAGRLIIVYKNTNIDLLDKNDNFINISSLYTKTMTQSKAVNGVYINGDYAYLAMAYGVVKIDMKEAYVAESYILDDDITNIGILNNTIYIKNKAGSVMSGQLTANLIDKHNWVAATEPAGIFNVDNSAWTQHLELVKTLQPGGPKYNSFGYMRYVNGRLYTCGGDIESTSPTNIQILMNGEWTIFDENIEQVTGGIRQYAKLYSIDVDPNDVNHIVAGARTGLYEYQDNVLVRHYNQKNSPIQTSLNPNKYVLSSQINYNLVTGVKFDSHGDLWCLNSASPSTSIMKLNMTTSEWTTYDVPALMVFTDDGIKNKSLPWMKKLIRDSRGYYWFVNHFWSMPSLHMFYEKEDGTLFTKSYFTFINQHGTTFNITGGVKFVEEDLNGDMWVATSNGPLLLKQEDFFSEDPVFTQVVVPRNDGTNYADYLLDGVDITCIAVDKANRKWLGTKGNGVYVISADNMTQEQHFEAASSPLLSDNVQSIAFNDQTGQVFIGTDKGLCSYMSDATEPSHDMDNDNVYAYPNPVTPGYEGLITIVGLAYNSDVKILSTSGQLVAQGRSKGGMFTWNGKDRQGRRVASGIYMVAAATSEGKKGTVCKIAVIQ